MQPRTKQEWAYVLTWSDWFMWLIRNHTPAEINSAIRAATMTLPARQPESETNG